MSKGKMMEGYWTDGENWDAFDEAVHAMRYSSQRTEDPLITPKMAIAGREALKALGYLDVEFTDAQRVYLAMWRTK